MMEITEKKQKERKGHNLLLYSRISKTQTNLPWEAKAYKKDLLTRTRIPSSWSTRSGSACS